MTREGADAQHSDEDTRVIEQQYRRIACGAHYSGFMVITRASAVSPLCP